MSFFAPLLLLGLLATIIPPILHLLNRKEATPHPFPAMEFLRRAYRKTARRMKIKQWLLIFIRSALLALFAFSLARPYWQPEPIVTEGEAPQGATDGAQVIIIDPSYPMAYIAEGESLLTRAKTQAHALIDQATAPVALVIASVPPTAPLGEPTADYPSLREAIDRVEIKPTNARVSDSVSLAFQLLKERPTAEHKRVILLTTPRSARANLPPTPSDLGSVQVSAVDLSATHAKTEPLGNHAILNVRVEPAPQMGVDQWRVEADVANYSAVPMTLWPIWVELEGEVKVRGFVSLEPGAVVKKRLYFKATPPEPLSGSSSGTRPQTTEPEAPRGLKGRVVIERDALEIDDERAFWVAPAAPTHLLALNGDPRPTPHEDELFYLEKALSVQVTGGGRFELTAKPFEGVGLSDLDLIGIDVVLLANVPRPTSSLGRTLLNFVVAGGGVWIAPGSRVDPERWNQTFRPLLPRPIRGPRRAGDAAAAKASRGVAHLSDFVTPHPLLSPFPDPLRSTLTQARIWTYMLFDPEPPAQTITVASLNEGSPYLITREVGEGRVLLMGGPIDREWSDFVIRPDFVPFVQQVAHFLTQRTSVDHHEVEYGHPLSMTLSGEGPFSALSPKGDRTAMSPPDRLDGSMGAWKINRTRALGHHRVISAKGDEVSRFVVHIRPDASDLRVRNRGDTNENSSGDRSQRAQRATLHAGGRTELWHSGLFGLFLFLLLEGMILFQRRRSEEMA